MSLVSVLDLDNTFVSAGIHLVDRGNSLANARFTYPCKHRSDQHQTEANFLLEATKQCCYCISLYDVNSVDPKVNQNVRLDEQMRRSALADLIISSI